MYGFVETAELLAMRQRAIDALASGDPQPTIDYRNAAKSTIEHLKGDAFARAQIGLLVAVATIRRDAGDIPEYMNDLVDAQQYAHHGRYDDIAEDIDYAIEEAEGS